MKIDVVQFFLMVMILFSKVSYANSFAVDFRNDLWTNPQTDRYLTNVVGVKIKHDDLYDFVSFFLPEHDADHFITRIQQDMYTPEDIEAFAPDPNDRPYAGHVFVEITKVRLEGDFHHYTTIQVGIIGPAALAAETQQLVHDWTGSTEANGWAFQLENELGINVRKLLGKKSLLYERGDIRLTNITYGSLSLGNVNISARAGSKFTFGFNPPENGSLYGLVNAPKYNPWSAYLEANIYADVVARDIFIDGNSSWFGNSTELERKDFVQRLDKALVIRYKNFYLRFSQSFISEQFRTQNGRHQFGQVLFQYQTDTESFIKWIEGIGE